MFSCFDTGYSIMTSFGGLLFPVGVIDMLLVPVSSSTSSLFSSLFASTHSIGSETSMLLPTFCRRRINLVNLYQSILYNHYFIFSLKFKFIMQAQAFAPGHITGFFKAQVEPARPELKGSIGARICIKNGVTTKVKVTTGKSGFKITNTGYRSDNTQVSEYVAKEFLKIAKGNHFLEIEHHAEIPV